MVMVGCNRKITQTAVIATYLLMCLNLFCHNKYMIINMLEMKLISINGSNCTQNTLKTSFDGVNSLISAVLMNQSNDRNTPEVDVIRLIAAKKPMIR